VYPRVLHGHRISMVNTFVTSTSLVQCARDLDWRRLGKQRVEAYQLWRALTGVTKGWRNHPAARAWEGYTCALAMYTNVMIQEWIDRGYKNTMQALPHCKNPRFPWWWGNMHVIMSHRASLNRKMPEYYHWDVGAYANHGYVWPSKVDRTLLSQTDIDLMLITAPVQLPKRPARPRTEHQSQSAETKSQT